MAFKDFDSIINNVSRLLGLRSSMVEMVVLATRKDFNALRWFKDAMGLN